MTTYAVLHRVGAQPIVTGQAVPPLERAEPIDEGGDVCSNPGCGKPRYQGRKWCVTCKDPARR